MSDKSTDNDESDGFEELVGNGSGETAPTGTDDPVGSASDSETGETVGFGLPWSLKDGQRAGAQLGNFLASAMGNFAVNILLLVTRVVPMTQKMWYGLLNASYKGLLKTSGGDAIMHVEEQGKLEHRPVKFKREREGSPIDNPRWVDQQGNWWHANDGSKDVTLKKQVPTVWASSKANELGNSVQAEAAEVLDMGGGTVLTKSATVNKQMISMTPEGGDQAVADGGVVDDSVQEFVSVADPGSLQDYLVDLDTALSEGDSGRVVSMDKYYETYPSKVAPEKMKEQENFGRLRELSAGQMQSFVVKVLIIAGLIIAAAIMGPSLIESLLGGGGGGGGGGVIPLVSSLVGV